jgi:CheY-like chemotaxis protein
MDVMMPVMDGIAATKAIRAMDRADAKTIPIIAMTANAFEEDAKRCFAAGMTAHLAKPFQIEDMEKAIVECCGK